MLKATAGSGFAERWLCRASSESSTSHPALPLKGKGGHADWFPSRPGTAPAHHKCQQTPSRRDGGISGTMVRFGEHHGKSQQQTEQPPDAPHRRGAKAANQIECQLAGCSQRYWQKKLRIPAPTPDPSSLPNIHRPSMLKKCAPWSHAGNHKSPAAKETTDFARATGPASETTIRPS